MKDGLKYYSQFLDEIKKRIRQAQTRAVLSANAEMILMYWDIGRMIDERQRLEGWGAAIIPRLSRDIRNELPDVKGFSERNIGYMIRFTREYPDLKILQPSVAKNITQDKITSEIGDSNTSIYSMLLSIPWAHNILLMEKIKEISVRKWYIQKTIENGWSRDVLRLMISNNAFKRQGKAVSNFNIALPSIGLILCQKKNRIVAEYTLRGFHKPIGISEYELTRSLPEDLKSSLPSIEEIEAELSVDMNDIKKGE